MRRPDIEVALRGRTISLFGFWRELRKLPGYLHQNEEVIDVTAGNFGTTGGRSLIAATNQRVFIVKDGWIFKNSQGLSYHSLRSVEIRTGLFFSTLDFVGEGIEITVTKVGRWSAKRITDTIRQHLGTSETTRRQAEHTLAQVASQGGLPGQNLNQPQASYYNPLDFSNPQPAPVQAPTFTGANPFVQPVTPAPVTPQAEVDAVNGDGNLLGKLERLAALKNQGVLSESEFQAAKSRLLHEY